jgi:hypothetical protein
MKTNDAQKEKKKVENFDDSQVYTLLFFKSRSLKILYFGKNSRLYFIVNQKFSLSVFGLTAASTEYMNNQTI